MKNKNQPEMAHGGSSLHCFCAAGSNGCAGHFQDQYGPPNRFLRLANVPAPRLHPEDAGRVLVAILASGPNFNTNFASLGLPVPVFRRGDSSTLQHTGSDALGIVVDAGAAVKALRVGSGGHLGFVDRQEHHPRYETHDGFKPSLPSSMRNVPSRFPTS